MSSFTPAEKCMLLLFSRLGEDPPLTLRNYRSLSRMLTALGQAEDPDRELDLPELQRLGMVREEAEAVLRRLDRASELAQYLAYLRRHSIRVITRISPGYPARLRRVLGDRAPMLLFCAGNTELLETECLSLVGSRELRLPGKVFARTLGRQAARQELTLVSGGAVGADTEGFEEAVASGGSAILFLADSLEERMGLLRSRLFSQRILMVSLDGPAEHFSTPRAYARNTLIHALGRRTFVAQSGYGSGGTWQGTLENLKHGWSPVFVCNDEPGDPGAKGLIERGGIPISAAGLEDIRALGPEQLAIE